MEARLLGTPRYRVDDREVRPPSRKAGALLAYLALEGPTPREKIAELLWPDLGPEGARHNLRQELYRLTKSAFGPHLEVTPARVGPAGEWQVDARDFEALARTGDAEAALARHGGLLLDGLSVDAAEPFEAWLAAKRAGLAELRRAALARLASRREDEGDVRGALDAHLALLEGDELQETHQREAIRLHVRLGERERALERYERFRALLAEELGLDPLPETQQEAERARRAGGAPAPLPATPAPHEPGGPPALRPPLVGRGDAWIELEASGGRLALLLGEAGVGKSRLALSFAATFGPPAVLRAQQVARDTPLYPVAEALRAALADPRARARLDALDDVWRAEAGRLVPELAPPHLAPGEGRARFVEGLARALLAAVGDGGALVFEDLHWLDASSAELLAHLARRSGGQVRLLATARPDELPAAPAEPALVGLRRDGLVRVVPLVPLAETDVRALVRALSGAEGASLFSRRLFTATGGNPLFVLETLRFLFDTGDLRADAGGWSSPYDEATEDYAELPIPPEVREAVLRRVSGASAAARRLLDAASLSGETFSLDDLAPAVALSEWEALEELERLVGASVLEPRPQGFAFTHDLVRRAVADELTPERRRLLHRRLAASVEGRGGSAAEIAEHLEGAGLAGQARAWREKAAEDAARVFAYREALTHLAAALHDDAPDDLAFALRLKRADLLWRLDDRLAREAELRELDVLAARLGDPARRAEVAIRRSILHDNAGRYAASLAAADEALAQDGLGDALRGWALYNRASALRSLGRLDEAEADTRAALDLAGADVARVSGAHDLLTNLLLVRGDVEGAARHNAASLAAWRESGQTRGLSIALNTAARLAATRGDLGGAIARLDEALDLARRLGDVSLQKSFLTNLVQLRVRAGDLDEALAHLQQGLDLVQGGDDPRGEGGFEHRLADVQLLRGRLGPALRAYARAVDLADGLGQRDQQVFRRLDLARLHAVLGDAPGARALLDAVRARFPGEGVGRAALVEARVVLASGDAPGAAAALAALLGGPELAASEARDEARALLGEARLALGDAGGALDAVAEDAAAPASRAARFAVRARAGDPRAPGEADALLASGRVPPLETLDLLRALGRSGEAADLAARLAATLPDDLRFAFQARFASPTPVHP